MELRVNAGGGRTRVTSGVPRWQAAHDVIVLGLGTAGAEAFAACVRAGVDVLGVERLGGMGGLSTLGGVDFSNRIVPRLCAYERAAPDGRVWYETVLAGVWCAGRCVAGLRLVSNGVVRDVAARIVIDATGNASVPRMCGCAVRKGRAWDGVMAPCARGETWRLENGKVSPNYCNYPDDVTRGAADWTETALKRARGRHAFWQRQRAKWRLLRPAALLGAREEVRVETEAIATMDEAIRRVAYPDPILFACEPEDLPVYYGDHAFESEAIRNWKVHCGLPMFAYPSSVPYGALVARDFDNLLVPSKHLGVAHDLGGSLRMQPEMRKTGRAAAAAARIMLQRRCAARDVPYAALKELLAAEGCLAPPRTARVNVRFGRPFAPFAPAETVAALRQDITRTAEWWQGARGHAAGTPAERAAYALWTAWDCGVNGSAAARRELGDLLASALTPATRHAGNFALALALLGDRRGLGVLREIVAHPGGVLDPVVSGAYPNRIKALDWLGRWDDCASAPILAAIVRDGARAFTADLASARAFENETLCRFQALSYALQALRALARRHPEDTALAHTLAACESSLPPLVLPSGVNLTARLRAPR